MCSNSKTFEVRQAQSSNSLYVLQPTSVSDPSSGLTAIAQCKAALELVPVQPKAVEFLSTSIPYLEGLESTVAATAAQPGSTHVSKAAIQADAPFSNAEFESAWRALCAFERDGAAWQPTAEAKISFWKALMSAAAVSGIKVTGSFAPGDLKDLLAEDGYEGDILMAVLRRVAMDGSRDDNVQIDRSQCASWLGCTILESAGSWGMMESALREQWQELLPDLWEEDARMEMIEVSAFAGYRYYLLIDL